MEIVFTKQAIKDFEKDIYYLILLNIYEEIFGEKYYE